MWRARCAVVVARAQSLMQCVLRLASLSVGARTLCLVVVVFGKMRALGRTLRRSCSLAACALRSFSRPGVDTPECPPPASRARALMCSLARSTITRCLSHHTNRAQRLDPLYLHAHVATHGSYAKGKAPTQLCSRAFRQWQVRLALRKDARARAPAPPAPERAHRPRRRRGSAPPLRARAILLLARRGACAGTEDEQSGSSQV
jgi:hypothetical protein